LLVFPSLTHSLKRRNFSCIRRTIRSDDDCGVALPFTEQFLVVNVGNPARFITRRAQPPGQAAKTRVTQK